MRSFLRKKILSICQKIQDYFGGEYVTLWFTGEKVPPYIHSTHTRIKSNEVIIVNWDKKTVELVKYDKSKFLEIAK